MSHSTKPKDELAMEIAKYLNEEDKNKLYLFIFEGHDTTDIERAYEEVKNFPQSKIKKSKSALFFYLLKKYAQKEK